MPDRSFERSVGGLLKHLASPKAGSQQAKSKINCKFLFFKDLSMSQTQYASRDEKSGY